jgi:ATP-dependent DNA helicase RecG
VPVIEGVADPKLALDHLHTAAALCSPRLELLPPERVDVDGCVVLVVTIPEGLDQVYSVDGRYLARGGSHRRALTTDEIVSLLNRRGRYAYDATIVPGATRADLDEHQVRAYAARFRSGSQMDADALLEARELLARPPGDPAAPAVPTVAGLLLLGTDPQRFLPHARIAVVRYAGATMGERFLARELEGPVMAQLDAAEAWLATNMLHGVELRGFGRTDTDEYPREAVREIVLNALAHRDYTLTGDRIRIYLFGTDRLEVHSPGQLGGPMRLDNLLVQRWSRNRVLVQGLIALGAMEELGFGLNRVANLLEAEALPPAEFNETAGTFVVTLRGRGARLLQPEAPREPTTPTTPRLPRLPSVAPTPAERQAWVLDHLRTVGPLSPRAYAEALGISVDTAQRDLRALVRQGRVQAHGTTHDRRYTLTG